MSVVVYRIWSDTQLLYLGCSGSLQSRLENHSREREWWSEVENITVEEFPDRRTALAAERAAIRAEQPKHNLQGKGTRLKPAIAAHRGEQVVLSFKLTKETGDRLRAVAAAEFRPVAAEIRRLIRLRLDEADREAA